MSYEANHVCMEVHRPCRLQCLMLRSHELENPNTVSPESNLVSYRQASLRS